MTNDNFVKYKKFIIEIMMKYKELFPIAQTIYDGIINVGDSTRTSDLENKLFRFELSENIGIDKHISDVINSQLWTSYFLTAPKDGDEFYKYIHILEKAMYNVVLSQYIRVFPWHDKNKMFEQMVAEL